MPSRSYSFDVKMLLADGAAPYTASGPGQVGGAQRIIDFGGAPRRTDLNMTGALARIDMGCVLDVTALNVANANNRYDIQIIGSNNPASLAGGQLLGSMSLGNTGAFGSGAGTSAPGRYIVMFSNEQNDIVYEYVGIYVVAAGTAPSLALSAYGVVLPLI